MTTTTIDLRTIPASTPSLCIPRVFANIGEQRIRRIFNELNMGEIERVDIVSKTTDKGEKFNRVFIHFKRWGTDGNAEKARQRLLNGQDIKIVYDDPWFWKISAYRPQATASQPQHSSRRPQQKAPRLELDEIERPDDRQRPVRDDRQGSYRDNRQRPDRDNRQRPVRDDRQRRPDRDNRPRTPDVAPPRGKDTDERPLDPHELAERNEIIRKNAAVASQFSAITSKPPRKLLEMVEKYKGSQKALTIETEENKVPCVRDQDIPCGCDDCIGGDPEEE